MDIKHWRHSLFAACLLLIGITLLPACGGGGGGGDDDGADRAQSGPGEPLSDDVGGYSASSAEQKLNEALGESTALGAVIEAVDSGYSAEQIARAGNEGKLNASGQIIEDDGRVLSPDNAPINRVVSGAAASWEGPTSQIDRANITDRARGQATSVGYSALSLILMLLHAGFPPAAVMDVLISGQLFLDSEEVDLHGERYAYHRIRLVTSDGTTFQEEWDDDSERYQVAQYGPGSVPDSPSAPSGACPGGTFTCSNGTIICADQVCNTQDNCGDRSDESATICGSQVNCCTATRGCPGETGSRCGEGCCCCPYGQACNQSNWAAGCVGAATIHIEGPAEFRKLMLGSGG